MQKGVTYYVETKLKSYFNFDYLLSLISATILPRAPKLKFQIFIPNYEICLLSKKMPLLPSYPSSFFPPYSQSLIS